MSPKWRFPPGSNSIKNKAISYKKLKKKSFTYNPIKSYSAKGKIYFIAKGKNKKSRAALSFHYKKNSITVKKGTKKGKYAMEINLWTSSKNYEMADIYKTVYVTVK